MRTSGASSLLGRMPSQGSEPYWQDYANFWIKSEATPGYGFQNPAVRQSAPPPTARFTKLLHSWSGDRRARLKAIMTLRDQLQQEILRVAVPKVAKATECRRYQPRDHESDRRSVGSLNKPSEGRRREPLAA